MAVFHIWYDEPPPPQTWIWAKATLTQDKWKLSMTCPSACCAFSPSIGMPFSPSYWLEAQPEDLLIFQKTRH